MNKILLTDIDDCIVDWSTHFRKVFRQETGHVASKYNSSETHAFGHIPIPELEKYITDFNKSVHFENLLPKANSYEVLNKLKSEGWTIVGITACGTNVDTQNARWKNLKNYFGEHTFSDVRFIEWFECKSQHLSDFNNCPFIEDNVKHAETALTMGHRPFIIHRSYRKKIKHPTIPCVTDWNEIYKEITK